MFRSQKDLTALDTNLHATYGHGTKRDKKVYGHSVSEIVRWMGAEGWTFDDAWIALLTIGAKHYSEVSCRTNLERGRAVKEGRRSYPMPELTRGQMTHLREAAC